jgi:hypothetical protein
MKNKTKIELIIDEDGEVEINAIGFTGGACREATAPLRKNLLDESDATETLKPEFHQKANTQQTNITRERN